MLVFFTFVLCLTWGSVSTFFSVPEDELGRGYFQMNALIVLGLLSLAVAGGIGFLNGMLVTRTNVPSLIVTLATLFVIAGLNAYISKQLAGTTQHSMPDMGPVSEFRLGDYHSLVLGEGGEIKRPPALGMRNTLDIAAINQPFQHPLDSLVAEPCPLRQRDI